MIEHALTGIPLPASIDREELVHTELILERDTLTRTIVENVACAWFDQYVAATNADDHAAKDEALDALATVRDWPAAPEDSPVTDLYDLVDALVNGGTVERADGMMVSPIEKRDPELGGGREYEGHLSCARSSRR